ncbi:MAG: phosphoglycerate kinase [Myxococcota bacterium]
MSPALPPTLDQLDFANKRVLLRVDFNVPLEGGVVTDDTRIRGALPTIARLRAGHAKVICCSHLGRPKGKGFEKEFSLEPVAARLAELVDVEVVFAHDVVGDEVVQLARDLPPGGILVIENLRFAAGEKDNDAEFARQLAAIGEVYVDDAFGAMHRPDASIVGVPQHLPGAIGLLVQKELEQLGGLLSPDNRPEKAPIAAILGGAKVSDKIGVIEALSKRIDHLLIGGAMAYTFLAAQGHPVGASKIEADKVELARQLLDKCKTRGVKVHLPIDHVVADRFAADATPLVVTAIPDGKMGLDIGPATLAAWGQVLASCRTVFWNGPMGVFEWDAFSGGTRGVAEALAASTARTIVGGGDSAAALAKFGLQDRITHVSTGGGASLEFLEQGDLVGLAALRTHRAPEFGVRGQS